MTQAAVANRRDTGDGRIRAAMSKIAEANVGPTWSWMVGILIGILMIMGGSVWAGVNARIALIETKVEANSINAATMNTKLDYIRDEVNTIRRLLEAGHK